jgi:hypothetical protein
VKYLQAEERRHDMPSLFGHPGGLVTALDQPKVEV